MGAKLDKSSSPKAEERSQLMGFAKKEKFGRVRNSFFTLPDSLSVQIFNAPHGLDITDLAKIPLGRGKIGMPQNDFDDKLNRNARTGSKYCGMFPEVMRAEGA